MRMRVLPFSFPCGRGGRGRGRGLCPLRLYVARTCGVHEHGRRRGVLGVGGVGGVCVGGVVDGVSVGRHAGADVRTVSVVGRRLLLLLLRLLLLLGRLVERRGRGLVWMAVHVVIVVHGIRVRRPWVRLEVGGKGWGRLWRLFADV